MKKIGLFIEKNRWLLYLILFVVMLIKHIIIQVGMGDDPWFLEQSKMGVLSFTAMRVQTWTSRNIIEFFMIVLLNLNKYVWVILDSLMFVLIYHSIKKIIFPKGNNIYIDSMIFLILLIYPFQSFSEAGWYATTLNYVWPLAFGLYGLSFISRILSKVDISIMQQIMALLSTLYATNQEQMCALYIGFYGLFIFYCLYKHIKLPKFVYILFAISLLMLGYHAFCPGNANRKLVETQSYYKEFADFSLLDKFVLGVITTISIGLMNGNYLIYIWNAVLIFIILQQKGQKKDIGIIAVFTILNLFISVSDRFYQLPIFGNIFDVFNNYLYMIKTLDYSNVWLYFIITYFIIFIVANYYIVKKYVRKDITISIFIIIVAAFCSRMILGLSASIFVSGSRTFINSYFLIFIASLLLLRFGFCDLERSIK